MATTNKPDNPVHEAETAAPRPVYNGCEMSEPERDKHLFPKLLYDRKNRPYRLCCGCGKIWIV